ncbi:MAG: 4Fe-4S binding protein [Planctomycetia bacterium]|nr:4Fe-4S binding protein [Planctomycetia bacterium]
MISSQKGLTILCILFMLSIVFTWISPVYAQKGSKPTFQLYKPMEIERPSSVRNDCFPYNDLTHISIFLGLMVLSAWAALRKQSRILLVLISAGSVATLGFLYRGCPCSVGSIQNITLGLVQPDYFVPWIILILFFTPLVFTFFLGRTFCGSVCPIGALQELILIHPIRIPLWIDKVFGLFRYIFLGLAVLFAAGGLSFIICRYDPAVGLFRACNSTLGLWIFSGILLLLGLFVGRPYCRFLCPYGALLSIAGSISIWKITVSPGNCDRCKLCESICPYNAILPPEQISDSRKDKKEFHRFLLAIFSAPLLILIFYGLGSLLAYPLAQRHPIVQKAILVHAEETGLVDKFGAFDESLAHYRSGVENKVLYENAEKVVQRFSRITPWFGAWIGLVFSIQFILLAIRHKRENYQTDPARCFSCGRCFWYCPNQKGKRILLEEDLK